MVADSLLFVEPRIRSHPEHVVVGETSASERSSKGNLLSRRGVKPEFVCPFHIHSHIIPKPC